MALHIDLPFNIPDAKRGEILTACSARYKRTVHGGRKGERQSEGIKFLTKCI